MVILHTQDFCNVKIIHPSFVPNGTKRTFTFVSRTVLYNNKLGLNFSISHFTHPTTNFWFYQNKNICTVIVMLKMQNVKYMYVCTFETVFCSLILMHVPFISFVFFSKSESESEKRIFTVYVYFILIVQIDICTYI